MHSVWFNGTDILQGKWQHGEKVGYCYPSGLEKTLCKWEVYVPLVTKLLKNYIRLYTDVTAYLDLTVQQIPYPPGQTPVRPAMTKLNSLLRYRTARWIRSTVGKDAIRGY
jgi:hypothetical protein